MYPNLGILKQETNSLHRQIEEHPLLSRLLCADLQKEEYVAILKGFYGFLKPIESKLVANTYLLEILADYPDRIRCPKLETDLRLLEADLSTIACPPQKTEELSQILGTLYVIEGSSLGANIIVKTLQKHPQIAHASNFYSGYGTETGKYWKQFCQTTENYLRQNPKDLPITILAAQKCFQNLADYMTVQIQYI